MSARVIFHIDLNAYYASAAQIKNQELLGKPVVVCRSTRGAVVTTASYEARAYGIFSAMPLSIAYTKCKDLIVVEPDFDFYNTLSQKFYELLFEFSDLVEKASIDECFLDVTETIKNYNKPLNLAVDIQSRILNELGLKSSIGVGPNKFLAKMASDMKKPMGITVLRKREVESKLWPLNIEDMYGIGKKSQSMLKAINVHTIGDLARADKTLLQPIFMNQLDAVLQRVYGEDSKIIEVNNDVKSISASNSLFEGLGDYEDISLLIANHCDDIASKMKKDNMYGLTLSMAISFDDSKVTSKSKRLDDGFKNYQQLLEHGLLLFDEFDFSGEVTYLSLSLSNLKKHEEDEIFNLFNINNQVNSVSDIIEKVNSLFNSEVLTVPSKIKVRNSE